MDTYELILHNSPYSGNIYMLKNTTTGSVIQLGRISNVIPIYSTLASEHYLELSNAVESLKTECIEKRNIQKRTTSTPLVDTITLSRAVTPGLVKDILSAYKMPARTKTKATKSAKKKTVPVATPVEEPKTIKKDLSFNAEDFLFRNL